MRAFLRTALAHACAPPLLEIHPRGLVAFVLLTERLVVVPQLGIRARQVARQGRSRRLVAMRLLLHALHLSKRDVKRRGGRTDLLRGLHELRRGHPGRKC